MAGTVRSRGVRCEDGHKGNEEGTITRAAEQSYHHTQKAPWAMILFPSAVLLIGFGWLALADPIMAVILPVTRVIAPVPGASFQHLPVANEGDRLAIRFGPQPLFQRRMRYEDIHEVEVGRSTFLNGWAIHTNLRGGWIWNVAHSSCTFVVYVEED